MGDGRNPIGIVSLRQPLFILYPPKIWFWQHAAELQAAEIIARKLHLALCDQVSFFGHRRTLQRKLA